MNNKQLKSKPFYVRHREVDGAPVAADSADLSTVLTANPRSTVDCAGYESIRGFVRLTGGTAPTVTLQPLELVKYPGGSDFLAVSGSSSSALSDGDMFEFTPNGAFLFVRMHAVTGSPTKVELFLAGAKTMYGVPGTGRV